MQQETKSSRIILLIVFSAVLLLLLSLYFFVRPAVVKAKSLNESGLVSFTFERDYANGDTLKLTMKPAEGKARVMIYDSTLGGKRERIVDASAFQALQA